MKRIGCGVLVLVFAACAPTPERVCDYELDLAAQQPDKAAAENAVGKRAALRDKCVLAFADQKRRDPKEFACAGKCILQAKFFDDVDTCRSLCAVGEGSVRATSGSASAKVPGKKRSK